MTESDVTENSSELLPCPFCGGEAKYQLLKAWCTKCGISTKSYACTMGEYQREEYACISAWNTRATVTPSFQHIDDIAVDKFAVAMKEKLAKKRGEGRIGWETCHPDDLRQMLHNHIKKGDPIDVANFCMMLWHMVDSSTNLEVLPSDKVAALDFPIGAIENGRSFADQIENLYNFKEENGNDLSICYEWLEFKRCFEYMADYLYNHRTALQHLDDCKTCNTYAAQGLEMMRRLEENKSDTRSLVKDLEDIKKICNSEHYECSNCYNTIQDEIDKLISKYKAKVQ